MGPKLLASLLAVSFIAASGCERASEAPVVAPVARTEEPKPRTTSPDREPVDQEASGESPAPVETSSTAKRARKLDVPEGYLGPIDPQWPPHHVAPLEVELKAGHLIRKALEQGQAPPIERVLVGDVPDVFAFEGRIGNFDYIEVILGPMKHPDEAMPLIVLLHGRGGRPTIPAGPYSPSQPLRLFIPRGPDKLGDGYTWLATWTNAGKDELLGRSLAGRVDELMPAIDAFAKLRKTLNKPIVVGFSQGGIMTFGLVTRYPERFAAAFPIAGWLPRPMAPKKAVDPSRYPYIHAVHGDSDTVVPTKKGRATVERLRKSGIQVDYTEIEGVGHVVTEEIGRSVRKWVMEAARSNPG